MSRTYQPSLDAAPAPEAESEPASIFTQWFGNAAAAEQVSGGAAEEDDGWGIGSFFSGVADDALSLGGDLVDGASDIGTGLWEGAGEAWDGATELGGELIDDAKEFGGELLVDTVRWAEESGVADTVVHGVGDALDGIEDAVEFVGDVGSDVVDAGGDALDWIGGVVDDALDEGGELLDWASETAQPLLDEASELVSPLIEEGGEVLDWVIDQGSDLLGPLVETGGELIDFVVEEGTELVQPLLDAGSDALDWAITEGAELLAPALELGEDVLDWVVEQGSGIWAWGADLFNKGGELWEDITEIFGADTENAGSIEEALSEDQMKFLRELYGDSLDLSQVRYTRDGLTPQIAGAPNTVGNTINLVSKWGPQIFDENGKITSEGMELVIHELAHVWQYQNDGWDYMPEAIWANAYHTVVDGDRNKAYEYDTSMEWTQMNPEQQGHAVEHAGYLMWRQSQGEKLNDEELQTLKDHQKYIDALRRGEGA